MGNNGWAGRNERGLCLLVACLSVMTALSAFGDGDGLSDAVVVLACLLGLLATVMAVMTGASGRPKGE